MTPRRPFLIAVMLGALFPGIAFEAGVWLRPVLGTGVANLMVPLLVMLPFYFVYVSLVRRGELGGALLASLGWALAASLVTIPLVANTGDRYTDVIFYADAYREEMFGWIRTGIGPESQPSLYVREHALHFGAFVVLSLLTVGFGGLLLGAGLLNYMNFYVGWLFIEATDPVAVTLVGWPVYAMIRVVGFIVTAIALTGISLRRVGGAAARERLSPPRLQRWLLIGIALVVLDAIVKSMVAPFNQGILQAATSI